MSRGEDLLKVFMAEHRIGKADLLRSRFAEHVQLKAKAIRHLKAEGLGLAESARAMDCAIATIRYWTNGGYRDVEIERRVLRNHRTKKFRMLASALEELHS